MRKNKWSEDKQNDAPNDQVKFEQFYVVQFKFYVVHRIFLGVFPSFFEVGQLLEYFDDLLHPILSKRVPVIGDKDEDGLQEEHVDHVDHEQVLGGDGNILASNLLIVF